MKRTILAASLLLLMAVVWVGWHEFHQPEAVALTPTLTGETEYCLSCHADLAQISVSHPVETYGCVRCHGGERLALDADLAHSTLRGGSNPSDLSVVETSCGGPSCHSGPPETNRNQVQRLANNLQVTYAGAIAAVRYDAGLQPDLKAVEGLVAVEDNGTPAQSSLQALALFDPSQNSSSPIQAFVNDCLTCHLSAQPLKGNVFYRQTGCAACHVATATGESGPQVHRLSTAIGYQQCNTCHNRGVYDVQAVHFTFRTDQPANRQQEYYPPGAPFTRCEYRLDCADCHTRQEIMGDGRLYGSMADARYIQCRTCHGTLDELPLTHTISQPDELALRLASLNPAILLRVGDTVIITEQGEPLWNTRQKPDRSFELIGKATAQHFTFRPVKGTACQQKVDQQDSHYCHACHIIQP